MFNILKIFRNFVRTLKVTNDCAERGVKLATDYASLSPRTARRGARSTRWWRQRGEQNQTPRNTL